MTDAGPPQARTHPLWTRSLPGRSSFRHLPFTTPGRGAGEGTHSPATQGKKQRWRAGVALAVYSMCEPWGRAGPGHPPGEPPRFWLVSEASLGCEWA